MDDEKKKPEKDPTYEEEQVSPIQKKIEDRVADVEKNEKNPEILSSELSKNRTHMSEHRTKMSEHRTHMSEHRTDLSEHRTNLSEERSDLSIERTRLSYDRTMMSWVRTSTSLLTFGFSMYKFFQEIDKLVVEKNSKPPLIGAKELGIFLIFMSFLGLLFGIIQNNRSMKDLDKLANKKMPTSASVYIGYVLLLLSAIIIFTVVFRI